MVGDSLVSFQVRVKKNLRPLIVLSVYQVSNITKHKKAGAAFVNRLNIE